MVDKSDLADLEHLSQNSHNEEPTKKRQWTLEEVKLTFLIDESLKI